MNLCVFLRFLSQCKVFIQFGVLTEVLDFSFCHEKLQRKPKCKEEKMQYLKFPPSDLPFRLLNQECRMKYISLSINEKKLVNMLYSMADIMLHLFNYVLCLTTSCVLNMLHLLSFFPEDVSTQPLYLLCVIARYLK